MMEGEDRARYMVDPRFEGFRILCSKRRWDSRAAIL